MRKPILMCVCLCVAIVLGAHNAAAQSQATTAEINGRVVDSQNAVLPGASVTVKSPSTGYSRTVVTNDSGLFSIPLLPPGEYELSIELAGFQTITRKVMTTVGGTFTVNQTLTVATVTETVVVEASSPIVETSATVRTTTVGADAIANLPINGRRFQDFITLTPTVQVDPQRGQLSFVGQRGINANVNIDGADYNQPFFGGIRGGERSNNAFTVPQEAVQEFQVIAAGYSAEFGRSTGGLVNAITKSGTNTPHGSVFYLNRNRDWADENAFGQTAAPTQQQFGGSIGGPIRRDRLFYFGDVRTTGLHERSRSGLQPDRCDAETLTTQRLSISIGALKRGSKPPTMPSPCSDAPIISSKAGGASRSATATATMRR